VPFIEWDPLVRASVFGAVFLVPLLAVLWVWYDTTGRTDPGRWRWRLVATTLVLLTTPAVALGAANLDVSRHDLMRSFGWVAIGSGSMALLCVLAFAIWGRSGGEDDEFLAASDLAAPAPMPAARPTPAPARFEAATLAGPAAKPVPQVTLGAAPGATAPATSGRDEAGAYLFVKSGPNHGRQFAIGSQVTIGRTARCGVALDDPRVSSEHGQLKRDGSNYVYLDLKSTNGSFLLVAGREERLRTSQVLVDGDEIRVGQTVLQFIRTAPAARR
jgi:hypothetical protein